MRGERDPMDRRAIDHELDEPGAQELLRAAPLARVAYLGRDGTPRVIPIGFLWTGRAVVMCTAASSPKVALLVEHPRVAVTIDVAATPETARSVLLRGDAEVEVVDGVPDEYLAASTKTSDDEQAAAFEQEVRALYDRMARITVVPTWARYFDFGAGRLPAVLRDLGAATSR